MTCAEQSRFGQHHRSPVAAGCNTQTLFLDVDDVDAHCERARRAGAKIVKELQDTDYGEDYWADRHYGAQGPEGHHWWFVQRLRG